MADVGTSIDSAAAREVGAAARGSIAAHAGCTAGESLSPLKRLAEG